MANAEVQQLIKEIRRNGFAVEIGEGGVGKVLWKGEQVFKHEQDGGTPVTIHSTPSDSRWRKNLVPILIRAKVLDKDPWSNHQEKKIVITPPPTSSFITNQLQPWIKRRLDEGFTQSGLARAIVERWPEVGQVNTAQVFISSVMADKKKRLTSETYERWHAVVEGWSKQPGLPPDKRGNLPRGGAAQKTESNGHAESAKTNGKPKRPSILLSSRALAMMMDASPDREEALLLHAELLELEERLYV